ncbi:hypothetical protein LY76DRAFT_389916 [Colletotrichum caudatum]|nr:hypothetical protein LY76DRAFT_389916 [Colletotrichum caudatum]
MLLLLRGVRIRQREGIDCPWLANAVFIWHLTGIAVSHTAFQTKPDASRLFLPPPPLLQAGRPTRRHLDASRSGPVQFQAPSRNNELTAQKKRLCHTGRALTSPNSPPSELLGQSSPRPKNSLALPYPSMQKASIDFRRTRCVSLTHRCFWPHDDFPPPIAQHSEARPVKSASPPSIVTSKTLKCGERDIDTTGQTGIRPQPDVNPPPPKTPNLFVPGFT